MRVAFLLLLFLFRSFAYEGDEEATPEPPQKKLCTEDVKSLRLLPEEMWRKIFKNLSAFDLQQTKGVCRDFKRIIEAYEELKNKIFLNREVVVNLQTTGLEPTQERIIEFTAIELVDTKPTGRKRHFYINPERQVTNTEFHGLKTDFLASKPTFAQVQDKIVSFIGNSPIVAQGKFVWLHLNAEIGQCNGTVMYHSNSTTNTIDLARILHRRGRHSLANLVRHYKVNVGETPSIGTKKAMELAYIYFHLKTKAENFTGNTHYYDPRSRTIKSCPHPSELIKKPSLTFSQGRQSQV